MRIAPCQLCRNQFHKQHGVQSCKLQSAFAYVLFPPSETALWVYTCSDVMENFRCSSPFLKSGSNPNLTSQASRNFLKKDKMRSNCDHRASLRNELYPSKLSRVSPRSWCNFNLNVPGWHENGTFINLLHSERILTINAATFQISKSNLTMDCSPTRKRFAGPVNFFDNSLFKRH